MRTLLGWAFDLWRNFWIGLGIVIDEAMNVFGDEDE